MLKLNFKKVYVLKKGIEMAKLIETPSIVKSSGNMKKVIREHVGLVNSNNNEISIAHMTSPKGWEETGQTPEFHEYTLVLEGELTVRTIKKTFDVKAGQSIITYPGEWVKYETKREGANYIAICLPAFSQEKVNRDE